MTRREIFDAVMSLNAEDRLDITLELGALLVNSDDIDEELRRDLVAQLAQFRRTDSGERWWVPVEAV